VGTGALARPSRAQLGSLPDSSEQPVLFVRAQPRLVFYEPRCSGGDGARPRPSEPSSAAACGHSDSWFAVAKTMTDNAANPVPTGVRAIAALFALCAIYLAIAGTVMLLRPGAIPMSAGAPLLFGLELSGPYMFLLMAIVGGGVAWGLVELNNIVRHAAALIAIAGIVMLVPSVSAATVMVQPKALAFGGLGIIVRVMVAWYLSRREVADRFKAPPGTK
jgi:hypothetical protein